MSSNLPRSYGALRFNREGYGCPGQEPYQLEMLYPCGSISSSQYLASSAYSFKAPFEYPLMTFPNCMYSLLGQGLFSASSPFCHRWCIWLKSELDWVVSLRVKLSLLSKVSALGAHLLKIHLTWGRNAFCYFQLVIHIKSPFGDIEVIRLHSFLLGSIHSILRNLFVVIMQGRNVVLSHIPGNIGMMIIAIHGPGREVGRKKLRIIHAHLIKLILNLKVKACFLNIKNP